MICSNEETVKVNKFKSLIKKPLAKNKCSFFTCHSKHIKKPTALKAWFKERQKRRDS